MPVNVKVALHVERADAIRAGRNKWGWVPTEIDLEILTQEERDALAECPERLGTLYITHVSSAPAYIDCPENESGDSGAVWLLAEQAKRKLLREKIDGPKCTEASSETALAVLRHLASAPERRLNAAKARKAELEALAREHGAKLEQAAHNAISDLDAWLRTPPAELIAENLQEQDAAKRFTLVPVPHSLHVSSYEALRDATTINAFAFHQEWVSANRSAEGDVIADDQGWDPFLRDGEEEHPLGHDLVMLSDGRPLPSPPELEGKAEAIIKDAVAARKQAIEDHRAEASQFYWKKYNNFEDEKQRAFMRSIQERREKEQARKDALSIAKKTAGQEGLLAWSRKHNHADLAEKIVNSDSTDNIAAALRAAVFDCLNDEVTRFKKITKTDLLLANPGFRDEGRSLDAAFEEDEADLGTGRKADIFARIVTCLTAAEVPAQFRINRHRAFLKRRNEVVGVPLEAYSVLVRAVFGGFEVSRAYELSNPIPVKG